MYKIGLSGTVLWNSLCVSGSLNNLLRELVAEFTLADNMSSTTSSLLRSMCHHDDSILLGSWLEETDHQDVEEMVGREEDNGGRYLSDGCVL